MNYSPAVAKVGEEGGAEGAQGTRADISLWTVVKTVVRHAVFLQPMDTNDKAGIAGTCSLWRTPHWSRCLSKEGSDTVGIHAGAGSWQACGPMKRPHAGAGLLAGSVTMQGTHSGAACS